MTDRPRRQRVPFDVLMQTEFAVHGVMAMKRLDTLGGPKWVVLWRSIPGGTTKRQRFTDPTEAQQFRAHLLAERDRQRTPEGNELDKPKRSERRRLKPYERKPHEPVAVVTPRPERLRGGVMVPPPAFINRSEPIPGSTDRVFISTRWQDNAPLYVVGVVDMHGKPTGDSTEHRDPKAARRQANKLYNQLTEETA